MLIFVGSFKNRLKIIWQVGECGLAIGLSEEENGDSGKLDQEFDDADYDGEHAHSFFPVVVAVPHCSPIDDPNHISDERECH